MKVIDYIRNIFATRQNHIIRRGGLVSFADISKERFGDALYYSVLRQLTTIYAEVEWVNRGNLDSTMYLAWNSFMRYNGERILTQLLSNKSSGYAVIGYKPVGNEWAFWEMKSTEYTTITDEEGNLVVKVTNPDIYYYVLKSPTFEATGKSDYEMAKPYIKYIDNTLNASNTLCERMGAMVIGSPSTPSGANVAAVLNKRDKEAIEKEVSENYGALKKQKQFMLLPQDMHFTTINLASIDTRLNERLLSAAKVIADLLGVPANQIAVVDANGGRSLSNGTELREGELQKYRAFRRLCNIFYDFATEIGLKVDYTIENEPKTIQGQTIEQV